MYRNPLLRFVLLYALMYSAFGVTSPFWPRFFESRGLTPEELGLLFSIGTAVRLMTGPVAGRLADFFTARNSVLAICTATAALVALTVLPVRGFWLLLLVSLCHAAALAPITTLADALSLNAASAPGRFGGKAFEYGWVRGTGSAAFIVGTLVAGQVVGEAGLAYIVPLHAGLLVGTALVAMLVPDVPPKSDAWLEATKPGPPAGGFAALLRIALFRRLLLVAGLVMGSHAMHDVFAVIRWQAAGMSSGLASVLWSISVAAEVVVFFLIGPPLIARLGPAVAAAVAATAGILRWVVMALSVDPLALVLVQPLHGLTFALLHLACMRLIAQVVPPQLAATGQAVYAFAVSAATGVLTLLAGTLYGDFGAPAFFAMAALCAVALPLTWGLRSRVQAG